MINVRLPSGRTIQVATDDPQAAAAAARRYVQGDTYESVRSDMKSKPGEAAALGGLVTFERGIPFLTEAGAGLQALTGAAGDAASGKGFDLSRNWKKARDWQQAMVDGFAADHPVGSGVTKGVAMAAPVAAMLLSGGAAAPALADDGATGIAGMLKSTLAKTPGRAVTGAATGAVYGASQPGTLAERTRGAEQGAVGGAVVGTVAPPVLNLAGKGLGAASSAIGTTTKRAANRASGGALIDPNQVASQRLVAALKADKATPDQLRQIMNSYLANGGTDPTLADLASRLPSGGQNTLSLLRGAAMRGSGRGAAVRYAEQTAADLQGRAIDRTRALTPTKAPAVKVKADAVQARADAADSEFSAPYANPVDARPVIPAMEGKAGRAAISDAATHADARRQAEELAQLGQIKEAANPPPAAETPPVTVGGEPINLGPAFEARLRSQLGLDTGAAPDAPIPVRLGTLHRIQIALNTAGRKAAERGDNALAGGLFQRASEIDDHLAAHDPDFAAARDNYARRSAAIDALDKGAEGLMAHPDDYAAALEDLRTRAADPTMMGPNPAGEMAKIGYRQAITDALGAPVENAKGPINRVSTSTNQRRNLETTFGADETERYRAALKDIANQARIADHLNPNRGSETAGRLADLGLVEPADVTMPKLNPMSLVLSAIDKVRRGALLTDAERGAIVDLGTRSPNVDQLQIPPDIHLLPSSQLSDAEAALSGEIAGTSQNRRATPR